MTSRTIDISMVKHAVTEMLFTELATEAGSICR